MWLPVARRAAFMTRFAKAIEARRFAPPPPPRQPPAPITDAQRIDALTARIDRLERELQALKAR